MLPFSTRSYQLALALLLASFLARFPLCARAEEAPAQTSVADLERRVKELEGIIKQMQAERGPPVPAPSAAPDPSAALPSAAPDPSAALPSAAPPADASGSGVSPAQYSPSPARSDPAAGLTGPVRSGQGLASQESAGFTAGWRDNNFYLRSEDGNFFLRFTGQIQEDYRAYLNEDDRTDIDTFLLRRARFGLEADLLKYYEFRFLPDFGQGTTVIQDCYMNVHYWDAFQVEFGKFKQPFSYEQLIQDRYIPTLERSLIDQLVPARDVGVMIQGQNLLDNRLDYYASVSNGEINGNGDTNDLKDLAGRVALRPFGSESSAPVLQHLQFGFGATTGSEQEPLNPSVLKTPSGVPFFTYNAGVRADGLRYRLSPEIVYFYGPFGFATQYYYEQQHIRPAFFGAAEPFLQRVPFEGYYVLATCLLTGETRTGYSQQIKPLRNFDPCHPCASPGAWEFTARVSELDVGNQVFQSGLANLANPATNSREATEMTLGFNWYLNPWVRLQFNWEHAWFEHPLRLGPGVNGLFSETDTVFTRFQFIF